MPTALHIAELSSQPPQGVGARIARRLGGALRGFVAHGISLAGSLRRPAAPRPARPSAHHPAPSPAARQPRIAPTPPTATPDQAPGPAIPGWVAGWFACRGQTRSRSAAFLPPGDAPFSPEAFPQLSREACKVLNTPFEDSDPEILNLLFATLAEHLADARGWEPGRRKPEELLSKLWSRLNTAIDAARPAARETAASNAAPADPAPTAPGSTDAPAPAASAAPVEQTSDPIGSPPPLPEAPAAAQPDAAAIPASAAPGTTPEAAPRTAPQVAPEITPEAAPQITPQAAPETAPEAAPATAPETPPASAPQPGPAITPVIASGVAPGTGDRRNRSSRRHRSRCDRSRSLCHARPRWRSTATLLRRGVRFGQQWPWPPWRRCYAACTGPP